MDISLFLILHAPAHFSLLFKLNHHIKMNAHLPLQNFEFPVLKGPEDRFVKLPPDARSF